MVWGWLWRYCKIGRYPQNLVDFMEWRETRFWMGSHLSRLSSPSPSPSEFGASYKREVKRDDNKMSEGKNISFLSRKLRNRNSTCRRWKFRKTCREIFCQGTYLVDAVGEISYLSMRESNLEDIYAHCNRGVAPFFFCQRRADKPVLLVYGENKVFTRYCALININGPDLLYLVKL